MTAVEILASAERRGAADLVPVPGFVEFPFNPLVYDVASRCLADTPVDSARHTAVVLASTVGDWQTNDLASQRLIEGRVHNPLLFMQSTANAIQGHVSKEFGLTGPLMSFSAWRDMRVELTDMAQLLLGDDETLDRVLAIGVELAAGERTLAAYEQFSAEPPTADSAFAMVLVRQATNQNLGVRS